MRRVILWFVVCCVAVASCGAGSAADPTTQVPESIVDETPVPESTSPDTSAGDPGLGSRPGSTDAKLESNLSQAVLLADGGVPIDEIAARLPVLRFAGEEVLIEVTFVEMTPETVDVVEAAGMTVSGEFPDLLLVTGSAALASLRGLAALPGVASIVPQFGATTG